jgi:hypothetical protein
MPITSPPPLALTDDQLDQIMRCAAPLHPRMRRLFVEHVAYRLRGKTLGDGEVFRACREVLRESGIFDPPVKTRTGTGKYRLGVDAVIDDVEFDAAADLVLLEVNGERVKRRRR